MQASYSGRFILFPVFSLLLMGACANDAPVLAPEHPSTTALMEQGAVASQSVVVETEEIDNRADGTVETIIVDTIHYDVHGNLILQIHESFPESGVISSRYTATSEYNHHGDLMGYVLDGDDGADGVIDNRTTMSTLAADEKGHPIRQVIADDDNADGIIDNHREITNEFDERGRQIALTTTYQREEYQYDAHGNLVKSTTHFTDASGGGRVVTLSHNVHNALMSMTSTFTRPGQATSATAMTSTALDKQGYPTAQVTESFFGTRLTNHTEQSFAYDVHHRVVLRINEEDFQKDGRVDHRSTTRFEYRGKETPSGNPGTEKRGLSLAAIALANPDRPERPGQGLDGRFEP